MEALLFTIDGHRYGVWKNQVSSVEKVGAVHRLPFLRTSVTVLAVAGDHTLTLADLGPCLGHPPDRASGASALVMSEQGQLRGFLAGPHLASREVEPEAVIPLPDYLFIPFIENFLWLDGTLVPMVAVRPLFDQIMEEGSAPKVDSPAIKNRPVPEESSSTGFRIVDAGKSLLALGAGELSDQFDGCTISRFPLLPPDVDGITILDDKLVPVIDLARRICRRELGEHPLVLEARLGSAGFGLLVDGNRGEWTASDAVVKDLPFICQTAWSRCVAIHGNQAAAIIDLTALLSAADGADEQNEANERYVPESSFPSVFGNADTEVLEIPVLGRRLAIPKTEASMTIPCTSVYPLPFAPGIVVGVGMLEGELLPVLDLARLLGESSSATAAWRMIHVSNGNFKALVLSEKEPEPRLLKPGVQRDVPVRLPYPVVYGCYTEGDGIRLILNVHALALHFDESRAAELLLPLSPIETMPEAQVEPIPETAPMAHEAPTTANEAEAVPPSPAAIEEEPSRSEPAASAPPITEPDPRQAEETPVFIDEDQIEVPELEPSAAKSAPPPSTVPPPPAAAAPENLAAMEEELFVEEVHVRKQVVVEEPAHRGRRMVLAFAASVLFLLGVVYGLYILGLARSPSAAQAVVHSVPAPQAAAPAPAAPQPAPHASPPPVPAGPLPAPRPAQAQPAQAQPVPPPTASSQPFSSSPYVVKEGDTLWDIAQRLTGDPFNYRNLAGRNLIKNPDLIFPGQTIQVDSQQKH
ncbi:MAG: chemotaxis protein CheW [Spirochaetia bacterium]